MYRGEKPLQTRLAPEWTLRDVAHHAVDFWLSTEDLPRPENRVTLRSDGRIALAYTPSNEEPKRQLLAELKRLLAPLGMHHDHLHPRHRHDLTEQRRWRAAAAAATFPAAVPAVEEVVSVDAVSTWVLPCGVTVGR